jgi:subtilase family serine protease
VQYYLSLDTIKDTTDKLLSGFRAVPILAGGASSPGPIVGIAAVVPNITPAGSYFLIACVDDARQAVESDENNNCLPSTSKVDVGKPDLVLSALSEPPPPATKVRGTSFSVTDTVSNLTPFKAGPLRVQYYLSGDQVKNAGDRLLTGFRAVAAGVVAGTPSTGTMSVTIPPGTTPGSYFLLACADDAGQVIESVETNNCRASTGQVTVTVGP